MIDRFAALPAGLRAGLAILLGVITALGFEPFGWWPLLLIGVPGLTVLVAAARGPLGAAGLGVGYGLGFLGLGVGWMQVIFIEAMVALVGFEALFYGLLGVLLRLSQRVRWWPLLAAGSWSLVEFGFARVPFDGFGWMRLGYAMIDSPLAGLYPWVGVAGVSFATALAGQMVAWVATRPSRRAAVTAGAALASLTVAGFVGLPHQPGPAAGTVAVGYVQGGAPGGGVYGLGEARTITRNQLAETRRLAAAVAAGQAQAPDFVVWPENSTDLDPFADAQTGHLVDAALSAVDRPILVGTITNGPGAGERQTTSLFWRTDGGIEATYHKRGIVPFGEWVPLRDLLLPVIPNLRYVGAQSVAGTQPGVLPVTLPDGRPLSLGVLVCYDLAFDRFAYDTVTHGGQVLLVQSSNAMYQGTGQIEQQFAITRVRAAELRREILVVTTSGISGLITADGSVAFSVPDYTAASGVVELPIRQGTTPAARLATWLELAVVSGAALGLLWCGRIAMFTGPKKRSVPS